MYSNIRWVQRFQNYQKAFISLDESVEALADEPENDFIRDSVIQRYEYSIELAWKTLKDYLEEQGYTDVQSPKSVIRTALSAGYIKGDNWMDALNARNKTSHAYDEKMADEVVEEITESYFFLLKDLYEYFQSEIKAIFRKGNTPNE